MKRLSDGKSCTVSPFIFHDTSFGEDPSTTPRMGSDQRSYKAATVPPRAYHRHSFAVKTRAQIPRICGYRPSQLRLYLLLLLTHTSFGRHLVGQISSHSVFRLSGSK
ncbi:hypothetical protein AVEN_3960-1 [Araneus ventricosus]|uniref:Uncharacterized protein n=1 Tax=Araneus ventricosus TaxID=182803 RepID=A0A4Y2SSZ2_ARAVE|nr:hypothetical protein AVEN_3960-1 [Araneus ventricosus]